MRHEPVIRQAPEQIRMPKVEDFSPVVKAEMDHRAQPHAAPVADDRGPMGLLKRITNSLGRRDEELPAADMTAPAPTAASCLNWRHQSHGTDRAGVRIGPVNAR